MSIFVNPLKSSKTRYQEDIKLQIENHKKAAMHLEAAAKSHLEAVKQYEEGNHEQAAQHNIAALDHVSLALIVQQKLVKSTF